MIEQLMALLAEQERQEQVNYLNYCLAKAMEALSKHATRLDALEAENTALRERVAHLEDNQTRVNLSRPWVERRRLALEGEVVA